MPAPISDGESPERGLASFIAELVGELEPLHLRHNLAFWEANVTGEERHQLEAARLETQARLLFARRGPYEFLVRLSRAGGVPDPLLRRQLVLLVNAHRAQQLPTASIEHMVSLEKSLETGFNTFRAELDGRRVTDNELRQVLARSDDPEARRRAWEASKQIGSQVAAGLLELVRLRNEAACTLGYDNYYSMRLDLDELDEAGLFTLLDELEQGTRPLFERYRQELDRRLAARFGISPGEVRPWHLADPFFQEAPADGLDLDRFFTGQDLAHMAREFFRAVGLDVEDLLARADLYERERKCQHAFCLSVDRADDVRILCNLKPSEYWMSTLLHELGHAVHDRAIARDLPYLLRTPSHVMTTEASAMLFGRLTKDPAWLERWAGVPQGEARAAGAACARATRDQLLVQTRWMLVMCHMERALYREPGQDLDGLWWDLVERYQGLRRPPGRRAPDWASKVHFSTAPVYYHNYMLGEMMASQLQRHLQREVLGGGSGARERYVSSPVVGAWLEERLFRPGGRRDWRGTLAHATGGSLSAAAFVEELAAVPGA